MKVNEIITEAAEFVGTCVNSFDEDGYCVIPGLYNDVTDFAQAEDEAVQMTENEFNDAVGPIPLEIDSEIGSNRLFLHDMSHGAYIIYDYDTDVHYFFKGI